MSLGDASSNSNTIRDGTESQRRKKNMVNKIFTAMFLISVVAFAPAAAWATRATIITTTIITTTTTTIKSNSGDKR